MCNATGAHLHGGRVGFGARAWDVLDVGARHLVLGLHSEDGEENYPGRLTVKARFEIVGEDTLRLTLDATSGSPTPSPYLER